MRIDTHIDPTAALHLNGALDGIGLKKGANPVEAAKQFEEVLVREFVKTMTKDLFSSSLSGEEGAGWVKAQGDTQTDALTDAVTKHLLESGTLGISDLLMKKWQERGSEPDQMAGQLPIELNAAQLPAATLLNLRSGIRLDGEDG